MDITSEIMAYIADRIFQSDLKTVVHAKNWE